jgi:3-dehydroquinate dehydratase-2
MTILIVQGPHAEGRAVGGEFVAALRRAVQAAGHSLAVCECGGVHDLVSSIRALRNGDVEFVVLDPGELADPLRAQPDTGLDEALDDLPSPYIDIHDDSGAALASPGAARHAPVATIVINGDLSTSYRIAMGIALRQLAA